MKDNQRPASPDRRHMSVYAMAAAGLAILEAMIQVALRLVVPRLADWLSRVIPEPPEWVLPLLSYPTAMLVVSAPLVLLVATLLAILAVVEIRQHPRRVRGMALAIGTMLVSVAYPGWFCWASIERDLEKNRLAACESNEQELLIALLAYASDHGDTFPSASTWCDALKPYVRDQSVFVCPAARKLRCGYAFNSALSGVSLDAVADPHDVVAIFESDAGWNASGGPELLPKKPRHGGGDICAFASGAIEWRRRGDPELQWKPTPAASVPP